MTANIEIAGMWELGWNTPIKEVDLWEMAMREFAVQRLNMAPISGICCKWLHEYQSLHEILEDRSQLTPVFVDEKGAVEISDFSHPENALYVFGKGNWSPFNNLAKNHLSVRIDSDLPGMLWPHQALALVLYFRRRK